MRVNRCFNIDLVAFLKICTDVEAFIKSESLLSFFLMYVCV